MLFWATNIPLELIILSIDLSRQTMSKMARMDSEPNINVWLAHDSTLANFVGPDGSMKTLDGSEDELKEIKERHRV